MTYPSPPFPGVRQATFADIDPLHTTYSQVEGDLSSSTDGRLTKAIIADLG